MKLHEFVEGLIEIILTLLFIAVIIFLMCLPFGIYYGTLHDDKLKQDYIELSLKNKDDLTDKEKKRLLEIEYEREQDKQRRKNQHTVWYTPYGMGSLPHYCINKG